MTKSESGKLGAERSLKNNSNIWKLKSVATQTKYSNNPKKCKRCNKELSYEQRTCVYCSHSCAASTVNAIKFPERSCVHCHNIIKRVVGRSDYFRRIFCNTNCQKQYRYKTSIQKWKDGKVSGWKIGGTCDFVKKYIWIKYNNRCAECGWNLINPQTKRSPLQIHHKDGQWKNNKEDNLILLCPNCHSLTATFGNIGGRKCVKGRSYRRKYGQ